ncbi:LysM peptidoglycan-binding domain-containing protein [Luteimonas sp. A277]
MISPPADPGNRQVPGTSTGQPMGQTHTVVEGESLSAISKKLYGNANRWEEIFEANRDQLDDPDLVRPGQTLRIP